MSIEGRIAVDVNFTDSATGTASSVKKIQLVDATQYTSGKVAIVTGTCGTAAVSVSPASYLDAAGNAVSMSSKVRVCFSASREAYYAYNIAPTFIGVWSTGKPGVSDIPSVYAASNHHVATTSGTASFTVVLYGT